MKSDELSQQATVHPKVRLRRKRLHSLFVQIDHVHSATTHFPQQVTNYNRYRDSFVS